MPDRALATIERIVDVGQIPDADAIERVRVRGWDVVTKRGEFNIGDLCLYVEVDSLLDVTDHRFAFLAPRGVRTDSEGRSGHVLRTARLRKQISQGLVLPLGDFPELDGYDISEDVTGKLGIVKWEPPIPASLAGIVAGPWPSWIAKTDEERLQNIPQILSIKGIEWVATEKIDGSSCTIFVDADTDGVCSRNLNLAESPGNTMWRLAREMKLHNLLRSMLKPWHGDRIAIQGEVYGEGIQGNPLRVAGQHFRVFNLAVSAESSIPRDRWPEWIEALSVPVLDLAVPASLDEALTQADSLRSAIGKDRAAEGIVWRGRDATWLMDEGVRASFKVLSNKYLLKHDN